jgi:hypothetical protein
MAKASQVKAALDHFGDELSRKKNVVGLGRVPAKAPGEWELAVYVREKVAEGALAEDDRIPKTLELPGGGTVQVTTQVIEQGLVGLEAEVPGLDVL